MQGKTPFHPNVRGPCPHPSWLARLLQVALQGIPDIHKVFIREAKIVVPDENAPDGYVNDTEWMLDTEGVNLLQARAPRGPAAPHAHLGRVLPPAAQLAPSVCTAGLGIWGVLNV